MSILVEVTCKYCDTVHAREYDVVCPFERIRSGLPYAKTPGQHVAISEQIERTPQYNFPVVEIADSKVELPMPFVIPTDEEVGNDVLAEMALMSRNYKNQHTKKDAA